MSRAGQTIRALARRRRLQAVQCGLGAIASAGIPFFLQAWINQLTAVQEPIDAFTRSGVRLPLWGYGIPIAIALILLWQAVYLWKRSRHADQGAAAEEEMALVFDRLKSQGWKVEYGLRDRRVGDIDVFLVSPNGKAFTIDVKSHRGFVYAKQGALYRRYGKDSAPFEKDFLAQAKRQALTMQERTHRSQVIPMIVFSHAKLAKESDRIGSVHLCTRDTCLDRLKSLG